MHVFHIRSTKYGWNIYVYFKTLEMCALIICTT